MASVRIHTPGFPRLGANCELIRALDAFARGDCSADEVEQTGRQLRARHWAMQASAGLDVVTVGDLTLGDHVAEHIALFGCAPPRFGREAGEPPLARSLALARGDAPLATAQWFDTGYHHLVPEFSAATGFTLHAGRLLEQVAQARALGHAVKAALIGPLTFLWLGREDAGFDRLSLLEQLLPAYCALLAQLKAAGAEWVQLDEPILGLDLAPAWRNAFEPCYWQLGQSGAQLMLATYFSPLEENLSLACRLPVAGLHVDGVSARQELVSVCDWLPVPKVLSVGIVDGRNIWRTDLDGAISVLQPLLARRNGCLWLAPSCSLLHVPMSLEGDATLDPEVRTWMACATEKLAELNTLKTALNGGDAEDALAAGRAAIASRARSTRVHSDAVAHAVSALASAPDGLPPASLDKGEAAGPGRHGMHGGAVAGQAYDGAPGAAAHGFSARLDGVTCSSNGWVQTSGWSCVKPPVIFGDVSRARSLAGELPTGLLPGPVTILQQSFVRDDQPRSLTALQIALALREEVAQLARDAAPTIGIGEPALHAALPLRRARRDDYLMWSTRALRVAADPVSA
ncbi:5-methyltetrahydropteroyltriglutamate--homocysteine S-methyltransferase [Massilia sp. PAMC28688]|uniref:5-methyltetrahydropteroyltriglutamate-- homocysteine S-methyltransferase n=1 Tax=Massilia sp. PAMC28688 TaxID=2861283 RepID=UPI001C638743|nr:5-methyltetrahydropteroyltriglutamate--homocysteine S-methyltransferase [Massilia sp. PAMC28688]QYF95099.1 5-methyltetrahydropteroyltriglutamate--homocysteine S-methyltransferase [Massilia sp. PAMC28688]